eukprot:Clim_evm27s199 gene=Clim_evmTU27s199
MSGNPEVSEPGTDLTVAQIRQYTKKAPPPLEDPYNLSKIADKIQTTNPAPRDTLIDLARSIQHADSVLKAATGNKLATIAEQIKRLQDEARQVMEDAVVDSQLHRAACNFQKRPGQLYHLYEKSDGTPYLSMLSPAEWGKNHKHKYLGSYRLELDQSWTPVEKIAERDRRYDFIEHMMGDNMIMKGSLFERNGAIAAGDDEKTYMLTGHHIKNSDGKAEQRESPVVEHMDE